MATIHELCYGNDRIAQCAVTVPVTVHDIPGEGPTAVPGIILGAFRPGPGVGPAPGNTWTYGTYIPESAIPAYDYGYVTQESVEKYGYTPSRDRSGAIIRTDDGAEARARQREILRNNPVALAQAEADGPLVRVRIRPYRSRVAGTGWGDLRLRLGFSYPATVILNGENIDVHIGHDIHPFLHDANDWTYATHEQVAAFVRDYPRR